MRSATCWVNSEMSSLMVSICFSMSAGVVPLVAPALAADADVVAMEAPSSGRKRAVTAKVPFGLAGQSHLLLRPQMPEDHDRNDQQRHREERADRAPQPGPEHQRQENEERAERQAPADDARRDEVALERCNRDE